HGFMAIDPAIFGDRGEIKAHFSNFLQELRDSPKAEGQNKIFTHGEKEVAARDSMMKEGIPINDNTLVEVLEMCEYLDMDFSSYFGEYRPEVSESFEGSY
ncbi:MAG: Ldh family oxidoreductase, partial [Synergistaceae bacterium]|nr:Ldh family oxidoreductase [Synergistaceae bacterium]